MAIGGPSPTSRTAGHDRSQERLPIDRQRISLSISFRSGRPNLIFLIDTCRLLLPLSLFSGGNDVNLTIYGAPVLLKALFGK